MAESSLSFVRGSTPMADGDPELAAIVESPRHVDAATVDGEKPKGGERTHLDSKARGQVRKAGPPSSPRSGCKDGLEDDGSIQTIRVSNAASSHWLAIEDDSTAAPSTPPAALYGRTSPQGVSLCEEQAGGSCKPYKPAGAGGQDGESLQGPHTWRKRLKSVSCLENGDVKREPRRELEHVQEKSLKDRRLSRDDHADDARARSDKIRISPSAKKESTGQRTRGQLVSKSILTSMQQSPNFAMSKGGRRGSKSQFDSESAFTRQVVKPMKSSVVQKNRSLFPSSYVASKNLSPPFAFSNKKTSSNHHLDAFGGSGQVTTKMVEKVMKARLYLLQQTGPNSFLIGGDSPDHKYRVIIGPQKCSCGRESLCIHLLFVMLRVFQVPENDPVLCRRPLRNYEVEALFRNYHARRTSRLKDNTKKKAEAKAHDRPASNAEGEEGDEDDDDDDDDVESSAANGQDEDGNEKEEEELCSICLLEMVDGESLTECKTGCQNRLHHHCIAIWFEECRRQKEALICPLCRAEWKSEAGESAPVPASAPEVTVLPLPSGTRESSPQNTAAANADVTPIEALPLEHREIADKWIPVLGEEIVGRLFSKNWGVREAALRLLSQEAVRVLLLGVGEGRSGVLVSPERQANNHTMLECCCSVLAFSLSDPVYKVFISGLRALRMILSYTPCRDELQQSRLQMLMKPVVKSLLLKCADSNRRTSQLSISALEELVKGEDGELAVGREIVNPGNLGLGGIGYLIHCLVEIDAVENIHWQWLLGRFCMLERLLEEYCHEFTVTISPLPPDSDAFPSSDWVSSSTNYSRAFSVLRFCTLHMSFAHIKVSKMARRVFYCIARLQLPQGLVFERVFSLLEGVDSTIERHMKRKLYALMEDHRVVPNEKSEIPISNGADLLSGRGAMPVLSATSFAVTNGTLPQVNVTASSPMTDVVTLVVSSLVSSSADDVLPDEVDGPRPMNSSTGGREVPKGLASLTEVAQNSASRCVMEIPQPLVEYADACVSTSPLPVQNGEIWVSQTMSEQQRQEIGSSNAPPTSQTDNAPVPNVTPVTHNTDKIPLSGAVVAKRPNPEAAVAARPDRIAMSLKGDSAYASFVMDRSVGSKESLCDSPPILSAQLDAAFGSSQVGLLTEDLSDLILSPSSRPEEKVSFKTEVATTPGNSPQRSANNTGDDGCHCKEEVEKEEAEALVEALERSDLPQDELPHVPGLSRGKSETTLTIHMQDQNTNIVDVEGFDSRQYQEGVHWKRGPVLGTGAFCTCYQARDNRTGTLMAVKQISFCRNTLLEQDKVVNAIKEEVHILGRISHPNVIRILGATQQGCHFFMFVEWMPGCSVATLLDRYGQFSEQVITSYTLQVLRGLAYLHDNQVVHRDLKGANLLVDSTGNRVRIGDFGAAARLATQVTVNGQFEGQLIGTIAFMAPEVLRGDSYGRKCDIWSFGCTMVEMATALPPWGANDISNHLALIFKIASTVRPPPIPENLSPPIRDVMLRCLEVNPEDRPIAKDLLKHPMFRV